MVILRDFLVTKMDMFWVGVIFYDPCKFNEGDVFCYER